MPSCSRDGDAAVGDIVGKPELTDAETEHRRICPVEIELPFVDLPQVDEQIGFDVA